VLLHTATSFPTGGSSKSVWSIHCEGVGAGADRKAKAEVNESVLGVLDEARDDNAYEKNKLGDKAWNNILEYMYLTGWVA